MTEQPPTQPTEPPPYHQPVPPPATRRLTRNPNDKVLGGVCAGLADYFGIDVTMVRVLTALGVVFGLGSVAVAYVIAWLLLPKH